MKLTAEGCRARQQSLLEQMQVYGVSEAVLADPCHVLYLSGFETPAFQYSAVLLDSRGKCTLACGVAAPDAAADEVVAVPARVYSTVHLDHSRRIAEALARLLGQQKGLLGLDRSCRPPYLAEGAEGAVDLSSILFEMRRRKGPDELRLIREAIRINEVCFERARQIIAPGISELEVYAELYRAAVLAAGERLDALGNDFQSGTEGGPPRNRKIAAGELFILDLGARYGGYYSDGCRTFPVGEVTDRQRSAWSDVAEALSFVEENAVAGYSCRRLDREVRRQLKERWPGAFQHHLGHGIGLVPHERPNLNPHWNHNLEEGDVITIEPGVYQPDLRGGVRLEEVYRVTATGLEKLTSFPLDLD
ncbi:MAG: Xaa-Pro peptidase family protein [Acidobacteriota bacterium]